MKNRLVGDIVKEDAKSIKESVTAEELLAKFYHDLLSIMPDSEHTLMLNYLNVDRLFKSRLYNIKLYWLKRNLKLDVINNLLNRIRQVRKYVKNKYNMNKTIINYTYFECKTAGNWISCLKSLNLPDKLLSDLFHRGVIKFTTRLSNTKKYIESKLKYKLDNEMWDRIKKVIHEVKNRFKSLILNVPLKETLGVVNKLKDSNIFNKILKLVKHNTCYAMMYMFKSAFIMRPWYTANNVVEAYLNPDDAEMILLR